MNRFLRLRKFYDWFNNCSYLNIFWKISHNFRIKYPIPKNEKSCDIKDLQSTQRGDYKPAYKKLQKTAGNQLQGVPTELAEIVAVWTDLPMHIKAAIKALIQTHKTETK